MPTQSGPATQGKKTHEDPASSKAMSARSKFRDGKPENRVGAGPYTRDVPAAEKLVADLGKG